MLIMSRGLKERKMDFQTVKEFAEKHSVAERTVRAWISKGKIPAQKFGRDWMIPIDTPKPPDGRYVESPIRNRRKKPL